MNRTQRILTSLALVLLQVLPAFAGGGAGEKALLWQISGKGIKQPSYLYGTIHAVCPDQMVISETLQAKLKQTAQLTLELDMDDPEMMPLIMEHARLPEGESLKAMFKEGEYRLLSEYFEANYGMDLAYLDNMKPFMLQTMLLTALTDCTPESYEQKLMELAHSQQKEVTGIETVQEQMGAIDKLPNSVYAHMLANTVKDIPQSRADYQEMVKLYQAQDLEGLQELMQRDYTAEDYKKFNEVFLVQRNNTWLPRILEIAKEKPTFFAVGAGHLTGESGLIALLRRQGYQVIPVK